MNSIMDYYRAQASDPIGLSYMSPMTSFLMQQPLSNRPAALMSLPTRVPVDFSDPSDQNTDFLTQIQNAPMPPRSSVINSAFAQAPAVHERFQPTTGAEMEANSRSDVNSILARMQALQEANHQNDRNMQWMSFFSKLASSKNPSFLGGLGEATESLTDTTGKQSQSNKLLERAQLDDELKAAQWREEQKLKEEASGPENALRLAQAKYYSQGAGSQTSAMGGATGALAERYMAAMAAAGTPVTFPQALYAVQTGFRQGTSLQDGAIAPIEGVEDTKKKLEAAAESGKVEGRGDITPRELKQKGKEQVSQAIADLKNTYRSLDKSGGIVNPDRDAMSNLQTSVKSSGPGQYIQQKIGTKEQSLRNDIASMEPIIINSIRQATGMSAKAMDSNAELLFYRAAVKSGDVKAQMAALDRIEKLYGLGGDSASTDQAPSGSSPVRKYNPSTGRIE